MSLSISTTRGIGHAATGRAQILQPFTRVAGAESATCSVTAVTSNGEGKAFDRSCHSLFVVKWVDGPVAAAWGALAAARVYGISKTGVDGTPVRVFRKVLPHDRAVTATIPVPGTHAPCGDGYEIAQVLAWVAARRGNIAQRLQWRAEIRELMAQLVNV